MYLLLAGSTIATLSAWAVSPTADIFDTGLAGHFASAIQQSEQDCLASALLVDGGSMLVMLDERGGVTEIDLGSMPAVAAYELRAAIPAVFAGAPTSITRDALTSAVLGAAPEHEEIDVEVVVTNGFGEIVIEHNGQRKVIRIDLSDLGSIDIEAIAASMDEPGIDMHTLLNQMMAGDKTPGVQSNMTFEIDIDGEHHAHGDHLGDGHAAHHTTTIFIDDEEGHRNHGPNAMEFHVRSGMPGHGDMEFHSGMMPHQDSHGDHADHEYFEQVHRFEEKLEAAHHAVDRLSDSAAVAVFGVWQARELLDPEARVELLAPMMNDDSLISAVRNAASFVVMEALGEIGDTAGATESLGDMIRRNGAM